MANTTSGVDGVVRYWTYYVADVSGDHTFHLTCSDMCNIAVALTQCRTIDNVINTVNGSLPRRLYKSEKAMGTMTLTRKYR